MGASTIIAFVYLYAVHVVVVDLQFPLRGGAYGHEPLSGDPLPMRFDGRYLVRNDRVTRVTTVAE